MSVCLPSLLLSSPPRPPSPPHSTSSANSESFATSSFPKKFSSGDCVAPLVLHFGMFNVHKMSLVDLFSKGIAIVNMIVKLTFDDFLP